MTQRLQLSAFDAVTFDFYGTIVDWEPEILSFLRRWTHAQGHPVSDETLLEAYDRLRQAIQNERPAWRYPARWMPWHKSSIVRCRLRWGPSLQASPRRISPLRTVWTYSKELRRRGLVLGALSNIDEASFEAILDRLGIVFDITVTAQRVGAYKPDLTHFMAALSDLRARGIEKERVLHVAQSKRADIVPATALGLSCVWVDRAGHVFGRRGGGAESARATYRVSSLAELLAF